MAERHSTVLLVDGDLALSLVLAQELAQRGINLIPSRSVKEARSMVATLKVSIDGLIINCRVPGVCALATEMIHHNGKLEVIGIASDRHVCESCRQVLTFSFQDSELRDMRWMHRFVSLVQSRLMNRTKPGKVIPLRYRPS